MGSLLLLVLVFGSIFVPVWLRRHPAAGLAIPAEQPTARSLTHAPERDS
ncbi:MAG: hypothetical protein QOD44_1373 [Solirubrobacteraceae bacterium]|jgi:hypothetical protein|nr:hypothetical protein [Solirubrobacteraceae bacterium]